MLLIWVLCISLIYSLRPTILLGLFFWKLPLQRTSSYCKLKIIHFSKVPLIWHLKWSQKIVSINFNCGLRKGKIVNVSNYAQWKVKIDIQFGIAKNRIMGQENGTEPGPEGVPSYSSITDRCWVLIWENYPQAVWTGNNDHAMVWTLKITTGMTWEEIFTKTW